MRRLILFLTIAGAAGGFTLGCHYHDYREHLYDGDLGRDTHGAVIYHTGAEAQSTAPVTIEEHHLHSH